MVHRRPFLPQDPYPPPCPTVTAHDVRRLAASRRRAPALALLGVFGPAPTESTALRWHVLVWDLWFLLWGLLLGTAAWQRRHLRSERAPIVR